MAKRTKAKQPSKKKSKGTTSRRNPVNNHRGALVGMTRQTVLHNILNVHPMQPPPTHNWVAPFVPNPMWGPAAHAPCAPSHHPMSTHHSSGAPSHHANQPMSMSHHTGANQPMSMSHHTGANQPMSTGAPSHHANQPMSMSHHAPSHHAMPSGSNNPVMSRFLNSLPSSRGSVAPGPRQSSQGPSSAPSSRG